MARTPKPLSAKQIALIDFLHGQIAEHAPDFDPAEHLADFNATSVADLTGGYGTGSAYIDHLFSLKTLVAEAARKARWAAEAAERAETVTAVTPGRQEITGTVTKAYTKENDFGIRLVWIVENDAGQRFWGTIPKDALGALADWTDLVGHEVTFTATVKVSDDDPTFGFTSRPAKATVTDIDFTHAELAEARSDWEYETRYDEPTLTPVSCCRHPESYHTEARGCTGDIQVMSDVWDPCPCRLSARDERVGTRIVHRTKSWPMPQDADLIEWARSRNTEAVAA